MGRMTDVFSGLDTSSSVSGAGRGDTPVWYRSVRTWLWVGLALRLALAPFSAMEADVSVWWGVVHHATLGVGLYDMRLFSYPPVYGYWLNSLGGVLHWVGSSARVLGVSYPTGAGSVSSTYGTVMPTILGAFSFKIPMILADVGTGWAIWRIALVLGASEQVARRSFAWWFLNPVVIWVGSVHGQIDSLAAFGIALAILALLSDRWGIAGAALSFGIAVKISPAFLVPTAIGYLLAPARRHSGRMWRDFVGGALLSALFWVGPEWSGQMLSGVLSRTAQVGPVGGLEWTGIAKSLPLVSTIYSSLAHHFVQVTRVSNWLQILAALAGGVAVWRRPTARHLIVVSGLVMMAVVSVNLVANPEFTLWFLPFVALGAGGLWPHSRRSRISVALISFGVLVFYASLFAPAYYFGVATVWLGIPALSSVLAQTDFLARGGAHFALWPAANWMRLDLVASLSVTAGTVLGARELWRFRADDSLLVKAPAFAPSRGARVSVVATALALVLIGRVGPALVRTPSPVLSATTAAVHSSLTVRTTPSPHSVVSLFHYDPARRITGILFFSDPTYPYVLSDAGTVLGTEQQVSSAFSHSKVKVPVSLVNATRLEKLLPTLPTTTLLVDVTGVLPEALVRSGVLRHWIDLGGRLAFGGYLPGVYSSGPAPSLGATQFAQAHGRPAWSFLPRGLVSGYYPVSTWAHHQSAWARALNIFYPEADFGLRTPQLSSFGGLSVGNTNGRDATIGFLPVGRGGVLIFTGSDLGEYEVDEAYALTTLVASNALAARGQLVSGSVPTGTITLAVPPGTGPLEVVVTDSERPLWVWTRSLPLSGGLL